MYGTDPDMRAFYEAMGGDEASEAWEESGGLQALNAQQGTTTEPSGPRINWDELSDFLTSAQGTTTGSALAAGAQGSKTGRHAREALDRDEALQYAKIASDIRQIELRNANELDQIRAKATADMEQKDIDAVDDAWMAHVETTKYMADMTAIAEMDEAQKDVEIANYIMEWYDTQRRMRGLGMADYSSLLGTGTTSVVDTGT
jgi:hypothetical protein